MAGKDSKSRFSPIWSWVSQNQWVYVIVGIAFGLLIPRLVVYLQTDLNGFLDNLVPEFFGMGFTILIIDRLDRGREDRLVKEQLLRQMHSYYNPTALQSIEELRVLGYLGDGSCQGLDFRGADWRDANLYQADLTNCDLRNTKIQKADLVEAVLVNCKVIEDQLITTDIMWKCILPDGSRYNGKYNLPHDFEVARRKGFNVDDPRSMADYYGVSLEDYLDGQEWANANPEKLEWAENERQKALIGLR